MAGFSVTFFPVRPTEPREEDSVVARRRGEEVVFPVRCRPESTFTVIVETEFEGGSAERHVLQTTFRRLVQSLDRRIGGSAGITQRLIHATACDKAEPRDLRLPENEQAARYIATDLVEAMFLVPHEAWGIAGKGESK